MKRNSNDKKPPFPGYHGRIWLEGNEGTFIGFGRAVLLEKYGNMAPYPKPPRRKTMPVKITNSAVLLLSFCLLTGTPACGKDKLLVATAVNFITPMTEIIAIFEQKHHVKIDVTYGSSGKLYAQLQHGAPYDLFLSADLKRPQQLHENGFCAPPFHYSSGSIGLWSMDQSLKGVSWHEILVQSQGKIGLASPEAAPYGEKASTVLAQSGLDKALLSRFIYGQSVGQTFLFTRTGGAQLGFVALSQALSKEGQKGRYWPIAEAELVEQWGCIPTQASQDIHNFRQFLLSEQSHAIMSQYGYQ